MKRMILCFSALLLIGTLSVGCKAKQEEGTEPLIVAMELAYPPFETKDDQGNPSGISVELAKALAESLGRPVQIENTSWDGLIPSLQTGKVDVIISSMTITDERKEVVDFSIPYSRSYLALLVNKESGINTVEDLNAENKVVAVKKGTMGDIYAKKYLDKTSVNAFSSENAGVTEVLQGKADAFIYDQLTTYQLKQKNLDKTDVVPIPVQDSEYWAMVVKKGNTELLEQINEFLIQYKENGKFEELTEKYLAEEKAIFDQHDFPWFFD